MYVEPEEFHKLIEPTCSAVGAWVDAAQGLIQEAARNAPTTAPSEQDSALEEQLAHPAFVEPVTEMHMQANLLCVLVLDHLEALAVTMTHARGGPIYAHWSLLRSIVETAPRACWLTEAGITAETRVRRAVKLRLSSLDQEQTLPVEKAARAKARASSLRKMEQERWARQPHQRIPRAETSTRLIGIDATSDAGLALWRITSGSMHGDLWALTEAFGPKTVDVQTRRPIAAVTISAPSLMLVLGVGLLLVKRVADSYATYFGIAKPDGEEWLRALKYLSPYISPGS